MGLFNQHDSSADNSVSSSQDMAEETYSSTAIGITLRKIREKSGRASSDIALDADVHPSYYSLLENGHNHVSVKKLSSICQVHDISLSYFFSVLEEEQKKPGKCSEES